MMNEYKKLFIETIREEYSTEDLESIGNDLVDFLEDRQNAYGDGGKMVFLALLMEAQATTIYQQAIDALAQEV